MSSSLPLFEPGAFYKAAEQNVKLVSDFNLDILNQRESSTWKLDDFDLAFILTLMQMPRGSFNSYEVSPQPSLETVTIFKAQHEDLLRTAQQFENLKYSLLRGGVPLEDLNVLMDEPLLPVQSPGPNVHNLKTTLHPSNDDAHVFGLQSPTITRSKSHISSEEESIDDGNGFCYDEKEELHDSGRRGNETENLQTEQRTIEIKGLPERATHLDLLNAIRGGAVLEMYLRLFDRSARVSFTEPASAREFMNNVKNDGLYVSGKKVEASWGDRQFYIRPYVKQNIEHGASRNLIIKGVNPNITSSLIRDHLNHIHNLVVVDIKFNKGNAYISTNSVHNAMYARSCMMSRTTYKGMRVEFSPDECARPYQKVQKTIKTTLKSPVAATKPPVPPSNRFEMLNIDEFEDTDESEDDSSAGISIGLTE